MLADNMMTTQRFKNLHTGDIWWVVDTGEDGYVFENEETGDCSIFLDEENFEEVNQ